MENIAPRKFDSTQQYLAALGFMISVDGQFFEKGAGESEVRFPITAIKGHTPVTFEQKMRKEKWLGEPTLRQLDWGDQFALI